MCTPGTDVKAADTLSLYSGGRHDRKTVGVFNVEALPATEHQETVSTIGAGSGALDKQSSFNSVRETTSIEGL